MKKKLIISSITLGSMAIVPVATTIALTSCNSNDSNGGGVNNNTNSPPTAPNIELNQDLFQNLNTLLDEFGHSIDYKINSNTELFNFAKSTGFMDKLVNILKKVDPTIDVTEISRWGGVNAYDKTKPQWTLDINIGLNKPKFELSIPQDAENNNQVSVVSYNGQSFIKAKLTTSITNNSKLTFTVNSSFPLSYNQFKNHMMDMNQQKTLKPVEINSLDGIVRFKIPYNRERTIIYFPEEIPGTVAQTVAVSNWFDPPIHSDFKFTNDSYIKLKVTKADYCTTDDFRAYHNYLSIETYKPGGLLVVKLTVFSDKTPNSPSFDTQLYFDIV